MTPAARIAASIEILDGVLAGEAAEKLLTTWGRRNRFAGSKDRAAIRDHVFDAVRCLRSYAALGGAETGRGLMLGACRAEGLPLDMLFSGEGYGPAPLTPAEAEQALSLSDLPLAVALDCPDWLTPHLQDSLGDDFADVMQALRKRAPVFLRVNLRRATREQVAALLLDEGIATAPHPLSPTALIVLENPRRVQTSTAYSDGFVELQDASSQAVTDMLPLAEGARVLDLCAGGGGKTLAMAGRSNAQFYAYDTAPQRMRDLPVRADRAGVQVTLLQDTAPEDLPPFDLVLADVPCSGSGAWRRSPDGKWRLTPEDLQDLQQVQSGILDSAADLVARGGTLAYATCSLLRDENEHQIEAFLKRRPFGVIDQKRFSPLDGGDGFFVSTLRRET